MAEILTTLEIYTVLSSFMITCNVSTNISGEYAARIFRVEVIRIYQTAVCLNPEVPVGMNLPLICRFSNVLPLPTDALIY